jgi:hypothetical protein
MNREDMEELIRLHVPRLANEEKDRWRNAEQLRSDFVRDYSPAKISAMQLDDFVIGKGPQNRSFCYRLERETDDLGRILGATAFKFGVYYGKTTSSPSMEYRFTRRWGHNPEESLSTVKAEILALLQAALQRDLGALNQNRLSPMFKGKLLFIYHPDEYAPIYSLEHLNYFVGELNLHANPKSGIEMQRALMSYRETWPVLMKHSAILFMHFLYQVFPQAKHPSVFAEERPSLPLLDQAIEGASFIDQMPAFSLPKEKSTASASKIDYLEQQKKQKRIGNRGEAIVLNMEQKRLENEGRPDLVQKIQHVSENSDREGYDILSFDSDGCPRYIEVKATSATSLERGFYISGNELEKSTSLPNYYIYIVFAATSKTPKILPIKEPRLYDAVYKLEPVVYHVAINPHEHQ